MGFVKAIIASLVITALITSGTFAAGFENSGIGVKARGMAGAFRAIADDWTAAYYNPAGYAFLYDNELGANSAFLHYRHEVTPDYRFGDLYESGIYNDRINYNNHQILSNPSGGFAVRIPLMGESVFGLSAYPYFDNNMTWNVYDLPFAYNNLLFMPDDQFGINLDVVAFQLTLAKSYDEDKFAFGIGLQVLRADLVYSSIYFRENFYDSPLGVRPWDKVTEWNKNDGNGWGFGLAAGLLYNINDNMKVGINARLPFDINIEGTSSLEYYMPYIPSIDGTADSGSVEDPGLDGTVGNLFVAGQKVVDSADFKTDLKLPPSVGIGIAYAVNENFTIALDAEYTMWSQFEGFNFSFFDHRGLTGAADTSDGVNTYLTADLSQPVEWDNTGKIMFGMNYRIKDLFTVLGGVSADQSPMRDNSQQSLQFIDTGDKYTFGGGIIWHYREWDFGVASTYTSYPELTSADLTDLDNDGLTDNFNGLYSGGVYETVLSFIYRF